MQAGASCYLLTGRDVLMPGTFVGWVYRDGYEFMEIESPSGKVYTCKQENVFDAETGRVMLFHRRAEQLAAEGYLIKVRNDGTFRVYHPKKHGDAGGYIVRSSELSQDGLVCDCPAHNKEATCKHVMAVCSLLLNKATIARQIGWKAGETRYRNLATALNLAA